MEAAGRLGLFLGLLALAWWIQRRFQPAIRSLVQGLTRHMGEEAVFGLTCLFALCFTALAQGLGFPGVLGTFFGAAVLDRGLLGPRHDRALHRSLRSISDGFLAAVFFATLGLRFSGGILDQVPLLLAVLAVSVATKLAAGWLGGRLAGLGAQESLGLGAILNARGVMELVVAQVALQHGLIGAPLYSVLVLMGLITTVLTPFLLPTALRRPAQG
jgi:Kef-type K+ transport system membrane component KefB